MDNLQHDILLEFVERITPDRDKEHWQMAGLTIFADRTEYQAAYQKAYREEHRDAINAYRREQRRLKRYPGR